MSPYDKALDKIWDRINVTPPMHQSDFAAIVNLFDQMLQAGKRVNRVDDIGDYLIDKGIDRDMAQKIQWTYEVLQVRKDTNTFVVEPRLHQGSFILER